MAKTDNKGRTSTDKPADDKAGTGPSAEQGTATEQQASTAGEQQNAQGTAPQAPAADVPPNSPAATAPPADEKAPPPVDNGATDLLLCTVPKAFKLTGVDPLPIEIKPGVQYLRRVVAEHWFSKAHGVAKAPAPSAATPEHRLALAIAKLVPECRDGKVKTEQDAVDRLKFEFGDIFTDDIESAVRGWFIE